MSNRGRHKKSSNYDHLSYEVILELIRTKKIRYVRELPNWILQKILDNQYAQNHKRNIELFYKYPTSNEMLWSMTPEGNNYWRNILINLNSES